MNSKTEVKVTWTSKLFDSYSEARESGMQWTLNDDYNIVPEGFEGSLVSNSREVRVEQEGSQFYSIVIWIARLKA